MIHLMAKTSSAKTLQLISFVYFCFYQTLSISILGKTCTKRNCVALSISRNWKTSFEKPRTMTMTMIYLYMLLQL